MHRAKRGDGWFQNLDAQEPNILERKWKCNTWIKILESENRIFLKIQDENSASIMNVMGKVTPYVPVLP